MATSTLRAFLLPLGRRFSADPRGLEKFTRTLEDREGAFHTRDTLGGPLVFYGADFSLLYAIERSKDRCAAVGFVVEQLRAGKWVERFRGKFSLSQVTWDVDACEATVSPLPDDAYQLLYTNWEKKANILAYAGPRTLLTVALEQLPSSESLEFKRIDSREEADYSGGAWSRFLKNTSWISGGLGGGTRSRDIILFRLARRGVSFVKDPETNELVPPDLSASGYDLDEEWIDNGGKTADYVKSLSISAFRAYEIRTYADWGRKYGRDLVLTECGAPSPGPGYLQVTGPDPTGANNAETSPCLNLRRKRSEDNPKALWWRFGSFRFTRCFPLLEGVQFMLQQIVPSLAPENAAQLSAFFTQDRNAATGETGPLNELPRLYLSAASDVKRPGSSEPASRLRLSLKDLLTSIATAYDAGWFIDELTGKLRLEHRTWLETPVGAPLDVRAGNPAPLKYSYLQEKMPRSERLTVQYASTVGSQVDFATGAIDYAGDCVSQEEGQQEQLRSVQLLTGDVRALVLSGDNLPDNALCLLAAAPPVPGQTSLQVQNGNQPVAASELLRRYHRRGRVLSEGTLEVQQQTVLFDSVKATVKLDPATLDSCALASLPTLRTPLLTRFGPDGRFQSVEENLLTGALTLTALHRPPVSLLSVPGLERQFNPAHYNPQHFA